jgi:surface antigen
MEFFSSEPDMNWTRTTFLAVVLAIAACGPSASPSTNDAPEEVNPSREDQALSGMPPCGHQLATYNDTIAYSNGSDTGTGVSCASGNHYQCVELVMRYFGQHFGFSWSGNANELLANAPRSTVDVYANGDAANPPVPGDMVVWAGGSYGHTAIVSAVDASSVTVLEQNVVDSGTATLSFEDGKISNRWSGWSTLGWAHAKVNVTTPPAPPPGPSSYVADFNGDGKADVLMKGGPGWDTTPVFFSAGNGSFTFANEESPGGDVFDYTGAQTFIGDFNGDGKADVMVRGVAGWDTTPIFFSNGDGTFSFSNPEDPTGTLFNLAGVEVYLGDFNGDGKTDVMIKGHAGWDTTPIFFSNGDGTFTFSNEKDPTTDIFNLPGVSTFIGDFNHDGKTDVMIKGHAGWDTTPIFFSNGDGSFTFSNAKDPTGTLFNLAGVETFVGDFNGDGKADVMIRGYPGWDTTPIFFSNGDGTFTFSNAKDPTGTLFNLAGVETFVADFNGDGKADVLIKGHSGWDTTPVFFSTGDGSFDFTNFADPSKTIFND